jgi:hypothetical protein
MIPALFVRQKTRILPSAASPHVPTRAVFVQPDVPDTAQRWRDRGVGLLVGLALVAAAWWGCA